MKKLLSYFLVTALCMTTALILTACGGKDDKDHNHSYGEWKVTKVATCTEAGEEARFCNCGEKQTVSIGALGHSYEDGVCERCNDKSSQGEEKPDNNESGNNNPGNNDSENNVPDSQVLKFTSNGDGTCYVSGIGTCTDTDIVIPEVSPKGDSVTSIGKYAFANCSSLESVVIPDSVESIGYSAFYECTSLVSVVIPDSVTSIGDEAFFYSSSLESVVIPDSVTKLGASAFEGCNSLKSINLHPGLTEIGSGVFSNCKSLESVVISDGVTNIGESMFAGCGSLDNLVIPNSVTDIGGYAFEGCENLTSIKIGSGVEKIGYGAFSWCDNLVTVEITDISAWCEIFFETSLSSNQLGVFNTLSNPLSYAKNLYLNGELVTNLVIPNGVTKLNDGAFSGGESLKNVVIPSTVSLIGDGVFLRCKNIESITISQGESCVIYELFYFYDGFVDIEERIYVPQGLKHITITGGETIERGAFYQCSGLASIVIPDSVTQIESETFSDCINLTDVYYVGSEEEWAEISIGFGNKYLLNATIHYNYVPEE